MIGKEGQNLVFLLSMPRSGSTALSMMLSAHTKISCPPEPWMLLFVAECLNLACVRSTLYGRNNAQIAAFDFLFGMEYEDPGTLGNLFIKTGHASPNIQDRNSLFCEFVRQAYNARLTLDGKCFFVDKTPRNYAVLSLIDQYFPQSKKIFLKRNPLDIAQSYLATWGVSINELTGNEISENSRDFSEGLFALSDYFSSPDPYKHVLAYEDLVTDCPSQLAKICEFIGTSYQPPMLEFYANQTVIQKFGNSAFGDPAVNKKPKAINSDSVGLGITNLKPSELQSLINILGGDVFHTLGYSNVLTSLSHMGISTPDERTAQLRRHDVIDKLQSRTVIEHDRKSLLGSQIEALTGMLRESESDRAARWRQIEVLTKMLQKSEPDRAARGKPIEVPAKMLQGLRRPVAHLCALFSRTVTSLLVGLAGCYKALKPNRTAHDEARKSVNRIATFKNRFPGTIAVDITSILPDGENGGAKIFVLELLHQLARIAPQTQFVLLTQAASHEELAVLDRPNMRRLMIVCPTVADSLRSRLLSLASRMLPHLPIRMRSAVSRLGYSLNTALKRSGSGTLLRKMGADLLFCPFTAPTYFEPGIPTVCTIYDLQYKTYPGFFAVEDAAHRDRIFIEACHRATSLAAISEYSRNTAIAQGGIDPARIRTIYLRMAQRISLEAEHEKGVLSHLGLTTRRYLIYPANFWKHKNHEMLLTAFGMACHDGGLEADIKLVCTGALKERQEWLMGAAHAMNLEDRVLFPGYLSNTELAALMANCSGMVFPSLYEGFGLPVIEAMAASVPVACSNTTSLPEVAADAAILFDPRIPTQIAQAMVSLVKNEALRTRLIQAGQRRAAEFSNSEHMANEYWELFQYALANEQYKNLLTGAYADGWVGSSLNIQISPGASARTLEIELFAPEWLPQPKFTVQTSQRGESQGIPLEVIRGTSALWSLPLKSGGGCYEIQISPIFVPAHSGHGDDQRELSVMLQRCGIMHANGECIELFPEKVCP